MKNLIKLILITFSITLVGCGVGSGSGSGGVDLESFGTNFSAMGKAEKPGLSLTNAKLYGFKSSDSSIVAAGISVESFDLGTTDSQGWVDLTSKFVDVASQNLSLFNSQNETKLAVMNVIYSLEEMKRQPIADYVDRTINYGLPKVIEADGSDNLKYNGFISGYSFNVHEGMTYVEIKFYPQDSGSERLAFGDTTSQFAPGVYYGTLRKGEHEEGQVELDPSAVTLETSAISN